jgi:hypothetical protein
MQIVSEVAEKYPKLAETVNLYVRKSGGPVFWEDSVGNSLTIVEAEPDKLTWEFVVEENHCNQ